MVEQEERDDAANAAMITAMIPFVFMGLLFFGYIYNTFIGNENLQFFLFFFMLQRDAICTFSYLYHLVPFVSRKSILLV